MTAKLNTETGDRHQPIEQPVTIPVGGDTFRFSLWVPRYIMAKLTREDWIQAGRQLLEFRDGAVRSAVLSGSYFDPRGQQTLRDSIAEAMNQIVYRIFTRRQVEAGNEEWVIPSTLQGERYA